MVLGPTSHSRWAYAASKAIDEFLAVAYFRRDGLPVVIARLFNTVGPRQTGRYGMVLPTFIRQALRGEVTAALQAAHQRVRSGRPARPPHAPGGAWQGFDCAGPDWTADTRVPRERLEEIAAARSGLPRLVMALLEGGARPRGITRAITTVSDAIAAKLIQLAVERLGQPPGQVGVRGLGAALELGQVGGRGEPQARPQGHLPHGEAQLLAPKPQAGAHGVLRRPGRTTAPARSGLAHGTECSPVPDLIATTFINCRHCCARNRSLIFIA